MTEAIIAGLILGLALIFSVGPVIFTIIKLRINYTLASAFYFVAGVWLSDVMWVTAANAFGGLLDNIILYKTPIAIAGGLFLIAIGGYYLFFKKYKSKAELDQGIKIGNATHARLFLTGFLINTLNPGVIALWLAAATKTIGASNEEKFATFFICLSLNIGADFFKIRLAGKLRKNLTEKNIRIVNKISGILFMAFGIALIIGVLITSTKR